MTNERHEKALEAAAKSLSDWCDFDVGTNAVDKTFAAYLQAMDAVIVPKDPTIAMYLAAGDALVPSSDANACWNAMLSKAPNHFTNGE